MRANQIIKKYILILCCVENQNLSLVSLKTKLQLFSPVERVNNKFPTAMRIGNFETRIFPTFQIDSILKFVTFVTASTARSREFTKHKK